MARALGAMEVFAHFCAASGIEPGEVDRRRDDARSATPSNSAAVPRARPGGQRPARPRAQRARRRRATATWRRSTRRRCADGAVLDLGGGSLQLVHVVGRHARELDSWRLGAVRMTRALPARRRPGQAQAAPRAARARHGASSSARRGWAAAARASSASAGPCATSRPRRSATSTCPSSASRATSSTREALDGLVDELAARTPAERAKFPGIKPVARRHHPRRRDRRADGAWRSAASRGSRSPRPACARACSSSATSAATRRCSTTCAARASLNLAAQYGMDPAHSPHTAHVARLALGLFDELAAAGLHDGRRRSSASCCGPRRCCTTSA